MNHRPGVGGNHKYVGDTQARPGDSQLKHMCKGEASEMRKGAGEKSALRLQGHYQACLTWTPDRQRLLFFFLFLKCSIDTRKVDIP